MIKKLFIIVGITFLIHGCVAPFSKFYNDQTGGVDITAIPTVVLSGGEPKLFRGNKEEDDSLKMLEDGYAMIGYSSFNAGNVDENGAISQAKKVHASVVIIYSKYTNTVSGTMPLTLPDTQTSTTYGSGNVYGSGNIYGAGGSAYYSGNANYSGSSTTTIYGSKTTYIPYSVRRNDYLATYWVKLKPPTFGTHIKDLTTELRQEIGSNKGMLITAVIKDSPAFYADIFRGDVLRKIGNIEIYSSENFQEALKKYQGKSINVLIYRNGKEISKEVRLN